MADGVPKQPMSLLAGGRIEGAADDDSKLLSGLVAELVELIAQPSSLGPNLDLNLADSECPIRAESLVTIGNQISSAKQHHRDGWKPFTR